MERIDLNQLPEWSSWPARLLGLSNWNTPTRDREKIEQEYNREKYQACVEFQQNNPQADAQAIKEFEFGGDFARKLCVSIKDDAYLATIHEAWDYYQTLLRDHIEAVLGQCRSIVELGSGYGYNLWRLSRQFADLRFYGGKYSANAVTLAEVLYDRNDAINVSKFDYYDPESYGLISAAEAPVLIITAHSIEQIPHAGSIIENLAHYKDKIARVIHFEPTHELYGDSLIGLMRQRYTELNDYNRDLLSVLRGHRDIVINDVQANVFGLNPLIQPLSFNGSFLAYEASNHFFI